MHRPIPDGFTIKTVSVTRKSNGFFVTFSLEDKSVPEIKPDIKRGEMVGIDVGLIDFFVTSDNESIAAPKYLRKSEENSSQHKGKCPEERKVLKVDKSN